MKDRNITSVRFIQVNQTPQIDSHLTAKLYVDNAIDESSLVRNNQDNDFNNHKLTNINSINLDKQAEKDNEVITKADVNQIHQEKERSRLDVGLDFYDELHDLVKNNQDNDLNDNKLTNLDSITVNRDPTSDNKLANKNIVLRFNQLLENYLKISVGNDIYNFTKYDKIQLIDVTEIRYPNSGYSLLPKWRTKNLNKNNGAKAGNFLESILTNSPTTHTVATILPPIVVRLCISNPLPIITTIKSVCQLGEN